ncbi:MAG: TorF family putative porin [Steroidobacteraceae bacterium]
MKQQPPARRGATGALVCACAAALIAPLQAVAGEFGGSVAATTDYVYRGLSQTRGQPAMQADLHYRGSRRWVVGAWASTVNFDPRRGGSAEIDVYAGLDWTLDRDWDARLGVTHYFYPDDASSLRYEYDEVSGSLTWQSRVSATVAWSPEVTRRSDIAVARNASAISYELTASQPLHGRLSAVAGLGYYDLPSVLRADYMFWNVGLNLGVGRAQLGLIYIATDHVAERAFGYKAAANGLSGSLSWRF